MSAESNAQLIRDYLAAMQSDDIAKVKSLSGPNATLEYPGAMRFDSPESLLQWSKGRHKGVRHKIDVIDQLAQGDDTIIYASGTLEGTWNDDNTFSDIRFIYRFCVSSGVVVETRLWSDVADTLRRLAAK